MSFSRRLGFFRAVDRANFSLKWIPCFLISRKCSNFWSIPGGGDPDGDDGISRFTWVGSVRSCSKDRFAEYGDCEADLVSSLDATFGEGPKGPTNRALAVKRFGVFGSS